MSFTLLYAKLDQKKQINRELNIKSNDLLIFEKMYTLYRYLNRIIMCSKKIINRKKHFLISYN